MFRLKNKKAFTLIELLVVMAIIGILVLLAMPKFMGYTKEARFTKYINDSKQLENASERYYMDKGNWPRLSDEAYSAEQINAFAEKIYDATGKEVTLDSEGKYYDIDYDKLEKYINVPSNKEHYILQNPVGNVYALEGLTEEAKNRLENNSQHEPPFVPTLIGYSDDLCIDPTKISSNTPNSRPVTNIINDSVLGTDYPSSSWWGSFNGLTQIRVQYDFSSVGAKVINKYTVRAMNRDMFYSVTAWDFEGSNDGVNWTTIHSVSGLTWISQERKTFEIENTASYKYYSFNFKSNGASLAIIDEIEMMEGIYSNPPDATNHKPTAVITMTPNSDITTSTNIVWDYTNSTDIDGDVISGAEWKNKQSSYTTTGTYVVELRVKDEHGVWSDWVSKTFTVGVSSIDISNLATAITGFNVIVPNHIGGTTLLNGDWGHADILALFRNNQFNGEYSSFNTASSTNVNWGIGYVFSTEQTVNKIRFYSSTPYTSPQRLPKSYSIEYWDNTTNTWKKATIIGCGENSTYDGVNATSANVVGWNTVYIQPVTSLKFRINFTSAWDSAQTGSGIEEVRMFK